ncbi:helix-turn-helix transcriptional regulator [Priestia aryabhattai]|uniref:helix-turn-helix transcriptional regulator n=1 Tax=Priestia aryabhattai TaxID=412384 RepID=UPI003D285BF3
MRIRLKNREEFKKILLMEGYSHRGLSRKLGLSEPYVNQIANGERNPSAQTAKKIIELLGKRFDDIFIIFNDNKS